MAEDCLADNAVCVDFLTTDETHVAIDVRDTTGLPVRGWIRQDKDEDGDFDGEWKRLCGSTRAPVRIARGATISVLLQGRCQGPGTITAGSLTVRLYSIEDDAT